MFLTNTCIKYKYITFFSFHFKIQVWMAHYINASLSPFIMGKVMWAGSLIIFPGCH